MFLKTKLNENISKLMSFDTDVMRIDRDSISSKQISIFDHYNVIQDDILQGDELKLLMSDIKKADINNDGQYSRKEIRKFLKSIPMDKKMSVRKFNKFLESLTLNSKISRLYESNGTVESFFQQTKPNCWLLSGIKSLSLTSWGEKAIKDSISDNDDGTYTIKLNGVNFETVINQEDIDKAREEYYSYGDLDVLFIELATARYLKQEIEKGNITEKEVLTGGTSAGTKSLIYFLTGKTGQWYLFDKEASQEEDKEEIIEEHLLSRYRSIQDYTYITKSKDVYRDLLYKLSENNNIAITCGFDTSDLWLEKQSYSKKDKNSYDNIPNHAYVIKSIEKDENNNIISITLINPWDSDILIKKSLQDFLNQVSDISFINETDEYKYYQEGFEEAEKIS